MRSIKITLQILVLGIAISLLILRFLAPNNSTSNHYPYEKFPKSTIAYSSDIEARVEKVFDGDTILLTTGEVVRYQGIDTPEIAHLPKKAECYGEIAKKRNEKLVLGKNIRLVKDETNYDYYGRLLRYIYVDGELINEKLVREGMAFVVIYPPDEKFSDQLKKTEGIARKENIGVWRDCDLSKRKKF